MKDWRTTHGHSRRGNWSPEYQSWIKMKQRCDNPNNDGYYRYGGRGIKVCPQWYSFDQFLLDMGPRPNNTSLERIDNNKNYSPDNCKWANPKEQSRNRVDTVYVSYNNKTKCLKDWSDEFGMSYVTFFARWSRGWTIDRIASVPVKRKTA